MKAKQSKLELDAIRACYFALNDLQDERGNFADREETIKRLRAIVRRGNAKELRRRKAEAVANKSK